MKTDFNPKIGDYVRVRSGSFQGQCGHVATSMSNGRLLGVRLDADTSNAIERGQSAVIETDFTPSELTVLR